MQQHKPWFDESFGFSDQKKQAKMQWVQDPSQSGVDILNNVRCEGSRHFRNKGSHICKLKLRNLKVTVRLKNISSLYRGISDFKRGYQPRTNKVKGEKGDLVADSQSILATWRNCFSQLLNVHGVNDVRQREIRTA